MKKNTKFIIGMTTVLAAAGILAGCGSKKYKITFVPNSTSKVDPIEIEWGQTPTLPESPTKEGYTFTGWYTDAGLTNPYVPAAVEADLTLYGAWSINTYNLKFSTGVEGLEVPSQTLKFGSKISVKNDITRDYYMFTGWYYDEGYSKKLDANDTMPGHDVTLYAGWDQNKVTIVFNANNPDAKGSMENLKLLEKDSTDKRLTPNAFKVEGMDFKGWSTTPDGKVEYLDGQDLVHIKENDIEINLYAVWELKMADVSFYALNDEGLLEKLKDTPVVKYGENVKAPEVEPSLVGYTFNGWGNMQPTTDVVANMSKVYYSKDNDSFIYMPVTEGENISGKSYYEVSKTDVTKEVAGLSNNYYALFNRNQSKIHFVESIDGVLGEEIFVTEGYYQTRIEFDALGQKPVKPGYRTGSWYFDVECTRMVTGTGVTYNDTDTTIYLQYVHNAHILSYNVDGGDGLDTVTRYYGDEIALPEPSKPGYEFKGWSTVKGSEEIYEGTMPDSDLTLYAVFTKKTYTIKLHGVEELPYTQTYSYGDELNLGKPTKTGYSYGGWYLDSSFSELFTETKMPDVDNLELFLKLTPHQHQITFDVDGGSTIETITNVDYDTPLKDLEIPEPTKVGYAFVKWVDALGNDVNLESAKMGDADLDLKAIYSAEAVNVNIVYKGQDLHASTYSDIGTGKTTAIADQKDFSISEASAKTFDGYVFDHSDLIDVKADGTSVIFVYYTRATMKVTFAASGITSEDVNVVYGDVISQVPEAFYKNGYESSFSVDGQEINLENYQVLSNVTINVTFNALPQNVTFNANGGKYKGNATGYVECNTGETVVFPGDSDTVREGYTLLGWSLTKDGDVIEGSYVMPADSVTLWAVWKVNTYTVSFATAQGDVPTPVSGEYGSKVSLPSISAEGYTFDGYKNADGASIAAGDYIMPLGDHTLTAQWIENTVKVVFHGNGSTTGTMADQTISYSGSKVLNANAFTKTGYSFVGWALSSTATATYGDKGSITAAFDKTTAQIDLYAVWAKNQYTITFDSNGGSNVEPITLDYQTEFDAPAAPLRKGYTFIGWFTEKEGGSVVYPEIMGAENVTYYAHWDINKYNLIFDSNGGSTVPSPEAMNQGTSLSADNYPSSTPTRIGYDFDGWYEFDGTYNVDGVPNDDWGRLITVDNITSFTFDGDDITFHARWIVKKHTVTYSSIDDSVFGQVTYNYGEAIEKPADPALEQGETFLGWALDKDGNRYFDFSSQGFMGDSDITLYAIIDKQDYSISFVVNGATVYSTTSANVDPSFLSYIKKLYGETQALEMIYAAVTDAVTFQITSGAKGSLSPITAVITYATVGGKSNPELYFVAIENQTSTAQAVYAFTVLSPIYGTANEQQYYVDILAAVGTLQSGDPTAITNLVGELTSKAASDPIYAQLLASVQKALPSTFGGSDDASDLTALAAYATVAKTYSRQELIVMFAVASGATQEDAAQVVAALELYFPHGENKDYYDLVAAKGAAGIESISNATSELLTVKGEEYSMYEANAYNPVALVEGKYFDGWREEIDSSTHSIKNYAQFVERSKPVEDIVVSATSTSSVTFTWDAIVDAYGYKVEIYNATTGALMKSDVVKENSFKMNGLIKGDSIRVVVTVLSKGANGEYRAESKAYSATSVVDGSTLSVAPSSLDSIPVEISYIHTVEDDIGKVSKAGDYYYVTEDDGQKTYIFFTNTTYGFGSRKLEMVTPGAGVEIGKSSSNADAVITYNETGSFVFSIDGVRTMGIVRAMPDSFKSGANFERSETATVQPNARDRGAFESADFLGLNKELYKIGAAETSVVAGSQFNYSNNGTKYFNGFKFDVDSLSSAGKQIKLDREYKFYKIEGANRVEVTNQSSLFFYDDVNDVFYFKKGSGAVGDISNLGDYEVEILPKADSGDTYVNTYLPKAIKQDANKMARFKKVIRFTLNEGVNVYDCAGLNAAMANKNCKSINIQTNIHAELAADMYGYMPFLMDTPYFREGILDWAKGATYESTTGLKTGDADIVDGTAVMTKEDGFGPKIFTYTSTSTPAFKDHKGAQVYYAGVSGGEYAIQTAKFKQNFDNGHFKILAVLPHESVNSGYSSYGYRTAQMFQRVGTGNVNLEINGNYYDVSAEDALFCRSANKNSFSGKIATYEIQSCHQMMFVNASNCNLTVKNMNVISNSSNVSALLGQNSKDVAEIMRFTSGGVSGFMNTDYNSANQGMMNLQGVNVTGSLIGIYCDSGLNASYCHVKDSWANGVYAYCDSSAVVSISNSVIESSGGCAVQVDDQNYTLGTSGHVTTPTAGIDFTTCTIENFVSGDEQWFKGYSMEVVALGLKSMIDNQVAGYGLTIIQEKVNPVSGLPSEYMNWEFFARTDGIGDQSQKDPSDITTNMIFGSDLGNTGYTASQLGIVDGSSPFAGAQVYSNADQSRMILMLNLTGEPYGAQPTLNPVGETQSIIVEIVNGQMGNMHLFFRQNNDLGWLQGMVQLFFKA